MKKPALLAILPLLTACSVFFPTGETITGSGNVITESRSVSGIETVALLGWGEVIITQGDTESLTIEAEDNVLPLLTSPVKGGTLELDFDRAHRQDDIRPTQPIRFLVTVTNLTDLNLQGSGNISADTLTVDELEINVTSAGDVTVNDLTANVLRVVADGSGVVTVSGVVESQAVTVSGSGDYAGEDLESQAAQITISGSGTATAWVQDTLAMRIISSGSIEYYGEPTIIQSDLLGSGDIVALGTK